MRFNQVDKQKLKLLYEEGLSLRELARFFGASHEAISKWLKRIGVTMRTRECPIPREKLEQCKKLYLEGLTLKEIGEMVNVTPQTISNFLKKEGVSIRIGRPKRGADQQDEQN